MKKKYPDIELSKASLEDLESILQIEEAAFAVPWSRKAFEAELGGNEFSLIFVACCRNPPEELGKIVGYVCIWLIFDELRFLNLAICPSARRKGVATELVAQSIELGRSKGVQRALLEVRESNRPAQLLYGNFGFNIYAKRRSYYTNPDEDAILMCLDLRSDRLATGLKDDTILQTR